MAPVGMGAVYTRDTRRRRLRPDDPEAAGVLLAEFYRPWASAVSDAVEGLLARTGRAVLLDVHSYPSRALPYERHGSGPRPAVCLGVDPAHTPAALVAAARRAFDPLGSVEVNSPFRGTYVPLTHYRRDLRVTSIMIEVRRDRYLVEPDGASTPGLAAVAAALVRLVDDVDRGSEPRP
jgi:N-formylglutamate deformylase